MYEQLYSYLDKYSDPVKRSETTHSITVLLVGLVTQLDKVGLMWKAAVRPDVYDLLRDMFDEGIETWTARPEKWMKSNS